MTNFDPVTHEQLKREVVGVYDRAASLYDQVGTKQFVITKEEATLYFLNESDWWAWEWSQASRFWLEGMSPDGLAKFKDASFERLKAMKGLPGIPMLTGALFAIANSLPTRGVPRGSCCIISP